MPGAVQNQKPAKCQSDLDISRNIEKTVIYKPGFCKDVHNFLSALQNGTKRHYVSSKTWEQMYAFTATLKSLGGGIYFLSFKNIPFLKRR